MEELEIKKNECGEKKELDSNVAMQIKKPGMELGKDKDHRPSAAASLNSHKCRKCFYSHFPSPNTSLCKWNKKKYVKKYVQVRLRGGASTDQANQVIGKAIDNAKIHGIDLHPGVENLANGNCVFESIIDSINTRDCFEENFNGTPDYWRNIWMTEVSHVAYENWNRGLDRDQWMEGWETMKQPGIYEHHLGDLAVLGIAHCTKKDILIFNTSARAHYPVYVIESSSLCGSPANTEIPICLGYDLTHYEALVPDTQEDILKTIELKQSIVEGTYDRKMDEFPFLRQEGDNSVNEDRSYAAALKRKRNEPVSNDMNV